MYTSPPTLLVLLLLLLVIIFQPQFICILPNHISNCCCQLSRKQCCKTCSKNEAKYNTNKPNTWEPNSVLLGYIALQRSQNKQCNRCKHNCSHKWRHFPSNPFQQKSLRNSAQKTNQSLPMVEYANSGTLPNMMNDTNVTRPFKTGILFSCRLDMFNSLKTALENNWGDRDNNATTVSASSLASPCFWNTLASFFFNLAGFLASTFLVC